jgi:hypothetical protein
MLSRWFKEFPIYALMGDAKSEIFSYVADNASDGMTFVETGVFVGGSFCYLGNELKKRNKTVSLNAVDDFLFQNISSKGVDEVCEAHGEEWRGRLYDLFLHNLEMTGISEMTSIHAKDSIEASSDFEDNSIDFIHFDANHNHDYVSAELEAWFPKLKEKSFVAGHDYRDLQKPVNKFFVTKKLRVIPVNNYESYFVKIGGGLE